MLIYSMPSWLTLFRSCCTALQHESDELSKRLLGETNALDTRLSRLTDITSDLEDRLVKVKLALHLCFGVWLS